MQSVSKLVKLLISKSKKGARDAKAIPILKPRCKPEAEVRRSLKKEKEKWCIKGWCAPSGTFPATL